MAIAGPTTDHSEIRRWAERHGAVPVEVLPLDVDSEPALLRLMLKLQIVDRPNVRAINWEEFFLKFDALGLALVYDDSTGNNEILQRDEQNPYRHPSHRRRSEED